MNKKILILISIISLIVPIVSMSQDTNAISVRTKLLAGNVHMLDCVGDFGGGNVAASVGEDGVLLVDAMFKVMNPKLTAAIATLSSKPIRIVVNTHFHGDHVEGSEIFSSNAIVIAHENLAKRFAKATPPRSYPIVTFKDTLTIRFNGDVVRLIHVPDAHTDTDVIVYFEKSKVLHLGDIFFFGMFPAVYTEGGGNIRNMVASLDKILVSFPPETKVIPGHGDPASMEDLKKYVAMLKETIAFVEAGIKSKRTLTDLQSDPIMIKYKGLSEGGAQTTPQYVGMLYKLLK